MAEEVFTLKLDDEFTGGVRAARAAWAALGNDVNSFDKRLKSVNTRVLNKQFKELQNTPPVPPDTKDALAVLSGAMAGATDAAASLAIRVGSELVSALGRAAIAFGKGAVDAADWGTRTRTLLTALAGGDAAKAARQIEEIRDVARSTSSTMQEATDVFLEFRKAGLPDGYARNLAKIRLDAAALGPEFASAVDSLKDMKGTAVPAVDSFKKLNQLTGGKFGEALGLDRATLNNAEALQRALGQIQPESYAKVFAVVGKNAGKIASDTKPVWQQIQNDISNAFSEAFDGVDLGPLREALKPLLTQLGPALKALAPAFTAIVQGATELATRLGATDWAAQWAYAKTLFEEFKPVLTLIAGGALVVAGALAAVGVVAIAVGAGVLAGLGVLASTAVVVGEALSAAPDVAYTAATNIVQGIVSGISSGTGAVAAAMAALASAALGAFNSTLGIASPSKVFAEAGGFIGEGAAVGIEDSAPSVQRAADALAPTPSAASGGKGGGTSIVINVNGAGDPGGVALEVERVLRRLVVEFA